MNVYLLCDSYKQFKDFVDKNAEHYRAIDKQPIFIGTDYPEKIMGLELNDKNFGVIGDPYMPYSFWINLQSRMNRS